MHKIRYAFVFCFVFCFAFPSASYAQMTWYAPVGTWSGPAQATNELIMDSLNQNSEVQTDDSQNGNDRSSSASLNYTASKSRTRANLQRFANTTRAIDPAGAAQLEQLFASVDVIGEVGSVMTGLGLSKDNVADAFAVYWISAWQAANGDMSDRSAATYRSVSAQVARAFSQSSDFADANDAQKQEMAEAMLIQAALIDGAKDQMSTDPVQMQALGRAVTKGAAASGLGLANMTLSENGFSLR